MSRRLRSEDGIALPVAVIVMSIALLLTGIALLSAISSRNRTDRDFEVKVALQAAQSGLDLAQDRMNNGLNGAAPVLTLLAPCLNIDQTVTSAVPSAVPAVAAGVLGGFCPLQHDTYSSGAESDYTMSTSGLVGSLLGANGPRTIVSTGTYGRATRRVAATLGVGTSTQSYFGPYGITSNQGISFSNGGTVRSSVRSNGRIRVQGGVNLCGDLVTSGPGTTPVNDFSNGGTYCGASPTQAPAGRLTAAPTAFALPPADLGSVRTLNNNTALCLIALGTCSGTLVGQPTISFDGRSITIPSGDYYFCTWSMTGGGGSITIPRGATVRVFIGSPENCGGRNVGGNVFLRDNGFSVNNLNTDPTSFQLYVVGSPNFTTDGVRLGSRNNAEDIMTIYAPNSTVTLDNSPALTGAVAADQVVMTGGGSVRSTASTAALGATTASGYRLSNFRECAQTDSNAPTAGCAPVSN